MTKPQFAFASDTNGRFRSAIHRLTGINLTEAKVTMVEQRLHRRVVENGYGSTETYLRDLMAGRLGKEELGRAIDLITTNTTSFFREKAHFDTLEKLVLPRLLADRRARRPRLKLWSAASSEGAEAYTLAMVLAEAQRKGLAFDWAILGTDISSSMLEKARAGIYDTDQIAPIEDDLRDRYLMASVNQESGDKVRIVPELRARVRFASLNLVDPSYPIDRDIDVIFLRNVLIYFNAEDREKVVRRLHGHLRPGGYLFVGHSEGMSIQLEGLERIQPTVFRKSR